MNLSGQFDLDTARELCAACAQTYAAHCDIELPLAHVNVTRMESRAAVASATPQTVTAQPYTIVAFRGSKSLQDWITDFEFRKVQVGPDKIHGGFYKAIQSALGPLQTLLGGRGTTDTPVFVTGHSLGGAMALLAAEEVWKTRRIAAVYTFGGPRVGDSIWANGYDQMLKVRTWRLVDELDVVPRLPFIGYTHAGNRVQLGDNAAFINPPLIQTLIGDAVQMWHAWQARRAASLLDHPIESYERRLAALKPTEIF